MFWSYCQEHERALGGVIEIKDSGDIFFENPIDLWFFQKLIQDLEICILSKNLMGVKENSDYSAKNMFLYVSFLREILSFFVVKRQQQ